MTALLACLWTGAGAVYLLTNAHIGTLEERIVPPMPSGHGGWPRGGGALASIDLGLSRYLNPVPRLFGYLAVCRRAGEPVNWPLPVVNVVAALSFLAVSAALLAGRA